MPYAALAQAFSLIEATTKRLEKTALLTALFLLVIRRSSKDDSKSLLQTVYLCINRVCTPDANASAYPLNISQLCPDYMGIELGIGESLLVKAIGESTGRNLSTIKAELKKEGDLGLVAMVRHSSVRAQTFPLLTPCVRTPRTARKLCLSQKH